MERWGITIPGPVARENSMKYCKFILYLVWALLVAADVRAVTIDMVTVGNPGNAADTTGSPNPAGSVAVAYRIGKYEISEQMIDKANTLGGLGITKILRGPDKPATSTSWNEAARFVNWLNTSQGFTPAYKFTTPPDGTAVTANENITLWGPGDAGYNPSNLFRNSRAKYFLPSVGVLLRRRRE